MTSGATRMNETTVLAALTIALVEAACAEGAGRWGLLDAAGLDEAALADADARVPLDSHLRLLEAIFRDPAPDLGLRIGARVGARGLGVVGHAMEAGATLGDALAFLRRYRSLIVEAAVPDVTIEGGSLLMTQVLPPRLTWQRGPAEAQAAGALTQLRVLAGEGIHPTLVELPHAAPPDERAHRAFFRSPLAWGAGLLRLTFPAEVLGTPLPRENASLFHYLSRRADALRGEMARERDVLDKVLRAIVAALSQGEPDVRSISRRVGMSTRSLQRRLAERGKSFAQLLDEVRRERALDLLSDGRLSVTEVGYLLGYAEPAAFHRAFKRWTGSAPGQYRRSSR